MEDLRLSKSMWVMVMMMVIVVKLGKSELIYVGGGKASWKPNVNLTEWASHEQFYVGDWLYFGFDVDMYNVLEVNKTSYENCIETGFIKNITKGGRDVFLLEEAMPYYFISGRGSCWSGMKVAISVENATAPPAPAPVQHKSGGSVLDNGILVRPTLVLLVSTLVWSIIFK
ncbi:hypothetical protein L6164_031371 [Bauhinia variegata]|uniref:Uncharacterized protein n=1 Tax=Bauhinia variegata TaxID=167791 RepID=A0ACB9LFL9_BAUVA|nr:hypothetical protein L6164_031371 [Bauhinia variegata]